MDIEKKIDAYEGACQAYKESFGVQQVEPIEIDLPFVCDSKGFYDPITGDGKLRLITTEVPDPDDLNVWYPTRLLLLSLEAATKPVEDIEVFEEDKSVKRNARDYLKKRKSEKERSRARQAGFSAVDEDTYMGDLDDVRS